jgi:hypothetical protein
VLEIAAAAVVVKWNVRKNHKISSRQFLVKIFETKKSIFIKVRVFDQSYLVNPDPFFSSQKTNRVCWMHNTSIFIKMKSF